MNEVKGFSWSLDISTTNVGLALWDEDGKLLELKHLELTVDKEIPHEDRILAKADIFAEYVRSYKEHVKNKYGKDIINVFIEAPFQSTPKNINTTAMLLGFNGIARYVIYKEFGYYPFMITVYESRKIFCPELVKKTTKRNGTIKETLSFPKNVDKKKYIWEKVNKLEPHIDWFYTRNGTLKSSSFDMSDSYAVGYAGLKILEII